MGEGGISSVMGGAGESAVTGGGNGGAGEIKGEGTRGLATVMNKLFEGEGFLSVGVFC